MFVDEMHSYETEPLISTIIPATEKCDHKFL